MKLLWATLQMFIARGKDPFYSSLSKWTRCDSGKKKCFISFVRDSNTGLALEATDVRSLGQRGPTRPSWSTWCDSVSRPLNLFTYVCKTHCDYAAHALDFLGTIRSVNQQNQVVSYLRPYLAQILLNFLVTDATKKECEYIRRRVAGGVAEV